MSNPLPISDSDPADLSNFAFDPNFALDVSGTPGESMNFNNNNLDNHGRPQYNQFNSIGTSGRLSRNAGTSTPRQLNINNGQLQYNQFNSVSTSGRLPGNFSVSVPGELNINNGRPDSTNFATGNGFRNIGPEIGTRRENANRPSLNDLNNAFNRRRPVNNLNANRSLLNGPNNAFNNFRLGNNPIRSRNFSEIPHPRNDSGIFLDDGQFMNPARVQINAHITNSRPRHTRTSLTLESPNNGGISKSVQALNESARARSGHVSFGDDLNPSQEHSHDATAQSYREFNENNGQQPGLINTGNPSPYMNAPIAASNNNGYASLSEPTGTMQHNSFLQSRIFRHISLQKMYPAAQIKSFSVPSNINTSLANTYIRYPRVSPPPAAALGFDPMDMSLDDMVALGDEKLMELYQIYGSDLLEKHHCHLPNTADMDMQPDEDAEAEPVSSNVQPPQPADSLPLEPIYAPYKGLFKTSEEAKTARKKSRRDPKIADDLEDVKKHGREYWVKRIYEAMIDVSNIVDGKKSIHRLRFTSQDTVNFLQEELEAAAHHVFDAAVAVHERGWNRPTVYHKRVVRGKLTDISEKSIALRLSRICGCLKVSKAAVDDAMRGGITLALLCDNPEARGFTKVSNNTGNQKRGERLKQVRPEKKARKGKGKKGKDVVEQDTAEQDAAEQDAADSDAA